MPAPLGRATTAGAMFGMIYGMLGGEHEALPRRRPATDIVYDAGVGGFVSVDAPPVDEVPWLGRGEVPGQAARPTPPTPAGSLTLAEEMQRLAAARAKPSTSS